MNGYKKGLTDGIRQAQKLVKKDISYLYGIMAVLLLEMGNTEEEVTSLMGQIEARWMEVTQSDESIEAYLERVLPFSIEQIGVE